MLLSKYAGPTTKKKIPYFNNKKKILIYHFTKTYNLQKISFKIKTRRKRKLIKGSEKVDNIYQIYLKKYNKFLK